MRTFSKNQKKIVFVGMAALLLGAIPLWSVTASTRGRLAAHFDLSRGQFIFQSYGLNLSGREYSNLLKERYGISTHVLALCIVSETVISYADSYNEISTAAANRKFGHDVFKECRDEARKTWEQQRALAAHQ